MRPNRVIQVAVVTLAIASCSDSREPIAPLSPVTVATVTVARPSSSVSVGQSMQLTATARDSAGNQLTDRPVSWSSSNTAAASISADGLVAGVGSGSTTITATVEGRRGTTVITVTSAPAPAPTPPPAPSPVAVASVTVTAPSTALVQDQSVQLTVVARDAAGTVLTGRVATWSSADVAVAIVSTTGLVTAKGAGSSVVRATIEGKSGSATMTVTSPLPAPPLPSGTVVLVGAGDISDCGNNDDEATAKVLDGIAGTVFTAGDNVYSSGTPSEFTQCYEPTWGRHKARTRPAPGNHDYNTSGGTGYYAYYGANAGEAGKGYYSYDLGAWHIISLNSNVAATETSAQVIWLKADLAATTKSCVLAYWHHPRFSSGDHGSSTKMSTVWDVLYQGNAEVVVEGHDHNYERFAPMTASGVRDDARGLRSFVVGTGGTGHRAFATIQPNSEYRDNVAFGVIKFELSEGAYRWSLVTTTGTALDSGSASCH